ncbi:MAG: protein tyrosine phosphatase (PTP) superfamily phosphohydrolase (DUF442 family) [Paraglaciecola sp.]|jgi:protein tyrosine phosphatase (PTP) superfamily phosphohydrolase (DUF442 family)
MIKTLLKTFFIFVGMSLQVCLAGQLSLTDIKNYHPLSEQFASAGMPDADNLQTLKDNGFEHIINLIPGDFSEEKDQLASLQMTFDQIAVDWNKPSLENFVAFTVLMQQYQGHKVLVHCQMNYRASVFAYLYEVTVLGIAQQVAEKKMLTVWQPNETWSAFITMVQGSPSI